MLPIPSPHTHHSRPLILAIPGCCSSSFLPPSSCAHSGYPSVSWRCANGANALSYLNAAVKWWMRSLYDSSSSCDTWSGCSPLVSSSEIPFLENCLIDWRFNWEPLVIIISYLFVLFFAQCDTNFLQIGVTCLLFFFFNETISLTAIY